MQFQTCWSNESPQHEFLMHAVLMIAAAHLSYLEPTNELYKTAELEHLSCASHRVRLELSSEIREETGVALFASCILLYKQAWAAYGESFATREEKFGPAIEDDFLLPLGAGIVSLENTQVWPSILRSDVFAEAVTFAPKPILDEFIQHSLYPQQLAEAFATEYFQWWPEAKDETVFGETSPSPSPSPRSDKEDFERYMAEATRLIPAMSVLKIGLSGVDIKPVEAATVRYLSTWPTFLAPSSVAMVKSGRASLQLLFYHYYKAVELGIPERYWWAQKRTRSMAPALRRTLAEIGIVPTDLLDEGRHGCRGK